MFSISFDFCDLISRVSRLIWPKRCVWRCFSRKHQHSELSASSSFLTFRKRRGSAGRKSMSQLATAARGAALNRVHTSRRREDEFTLLENGKVREILLLPRGKSSCSSGRQLTQVGRWTSTQKKFSSLSVVSSTPKRHGRNIDQIEIKKDCFTRSMKWDERWDKNISSPSFPLK